MVGNKSVNGLRIESVFCSIPLKINTGNTVIFINVIHSVLRVANFLSLGRGGRSEALCFIRPLAGFPCLQIRDFFFHITQWSWGLGMGRGLGKRRTNHSS